MSYSETYYGMDENVTAILIFYLIYMLLVIGFAIAAYVLRSLGMYTIAKRRGIKNPWFSWIPVVDHYLLGSISDQYQYVVKGKNKSKRKILLGLNITMGILYVGFFACYIWFIVNAVRSGMAGVSEDEMMSMMLTPVIAMLGLCIPVMGVAIALTVFRYMAMYDLYTSCSPQNNVMFLVLSIIFSVTEPFFIFFNRKKDDGMPPRKPEPRYIPVQPQYEAPQPQPVNEVPQPEAADPWNNSDNQ